MKKKHIDLLNGRRFGRHHHEHEHHEHEHSNHPLMRYYRPLHRLRDDLQRSIYMETFDGLGDYAVRIYKGLYDVLVTELDDPFVTSLRLESPGEVDDRQKVALVNLLAGQMISFLETEIHMSNPIIDEDVSID